MILSLLFLEHKAWVDLSSPLPLVFAFGSRLLCRDWYFCLAIRFGPVFEFCLGSSTYLSNPPTKYTPGTNDDRVTFALGVTARSDEAFVCNSGPAYLLDSVLERAKQVLGCALSLDIFFCCGWSL